jgi:predicted DCC family thiol-disulfide oxidoreductase YuxK
MEIESKPKVKIYYDGVCNLCAGLAETIDLSQRGSHFALNDISKDELPVGVTMQEATRDVHVVDENGKMYRGSEAVMRILSEYPRLRWIAAICSVPGFSHVAILIYRVIEKTRYWIFGRKNV